MDKLRAKFGLIHEIGIEAYRKVGHTLVNSNKRIVQFNSDIGKAGVLESRLVGHVHHVKVVLKSY